MKEAAQEVAPSHAIASSAKAIKRPLSATVFVAPVACCRLSESARPHRAHCYLQA
jgi:hypothetical protein